VPREIQFVGKFSILCTSQALRWLRGRIRGGWHEYEPHSQSQSLSTPQRQLFLWVNPRSLEDIIAICISRPYEGRGLGALPTISQELHFVWAQSGHDSPQSCELTSRLHTQHRHPVATAGEGRFHMPSRFWPGISAVLEPSKRVRRPRGGGEKKKKTFPSFHLIRIPVRY